MKSHYSGCLLEDKCTCDDLDEMDRIEEETADQPASQGPASSDCYAVVACRWGWTNNGFDILRLTTDKEQAIREAEEYAEYRGGKYGVGVFDSAGKQIHHTSSTYGEKDIHRNWRMDTFENVGGLMVCAFETNEEPDLERAKRRWEQGVASEKLFSNAR